MLSITNLTLRRVPKIPFQKIKEEVLGKKYELSLVLAGNALMKKLNTEYRHKNKIASVLSFPLSKKEGEIFINLSQKKHSPLFLFIHALLHLKGLEHSVKMKRQEQELMKRYGQRHHHRP
ncbi:MAG: rRNA maturation RNAse YbeY [Candidatus Tagabacteria bacterium]